MGILSYTYNAAKKAFRSKNVTPGQAIKKVQPGTKLSYKRKQQDDFVKFRDNLHNSAKFDTATKNKLKSKAPLTKINKKTSDIFTPKEPKFSKGGRVGLKKGGGSDLGMQSVKYGLDNKPEITKLDRIAKFIAKDKKKKSKSPMDKQVRQKVAFGGGADMGKVASDKTKTEVKKYEKRAKDASKFLKNKNRSFGSIMREKYMR